MFEGSQLVQQSNGNNDTNESSVVKVTNKLRELVKDCKSENCSLISQHSVSGRIGRSLMTSEQQPWRESDCVAACAVCKYKGIGVSYNENELKKLAEGSQSEELNEREDDESIIIRSRALSCLAETKLLSAEATIVQESVDILKSCAKDKDGYALFLLGVLYEQGAYGIKQDEERGKDLINKSKQHGILDAPFLTQQEDEGETNYKGLESSILRMYFNTLLNPKLDLISLYINIT